MEGVTRLVRARLSIEGLAAWLNRMLQDFGSPLIEALTCRLRSNERAAMNFWRDPQQQLA